MKEIVVITKKIRMQKGLTCQQVADRCGISNAEVNRIENGQRDPTIKTLFAISQALGVALEDTYEIREIVKNPQSG